MPRQGCALPRNDNVLDPLRGGQGHGVADAGDGLPLGGGHGGVEGPGGAEEQIVPPPLCQSGEEIAGEHCGGAATARAAAVDVLALLVEEQTAAVCVVFQDDAPALQQLQQQLKQL